MRLRVYGELVVLISARKVDSRSLAMDTAWHMFSYEYEVRDLAGNVVSTGQVTLDRAAQLGDDLGLNSSSAVVVDIYRSRNGDGRLILAPSPAY
jgi:hypothetical protein